MYRVINFTTRKTYSIVIASELISRGSLFLFFVVFLVCSLVAESSLEQVAMAY